MIKKYYTCELTDGKNDKQLVGSAVIGVWFWQSPLFAFEKIKLKASFWAVINFRRIK